MNTDEKMMRVVTLKDLWDLFLQRLWIIILAAVVAVAGLFTFVQLTFTPRYEATATLYILRQKENTPNGGSSEDFSLALKVVNDCTYLLKSHSVLDEVIASQNLNISYSELYKSVSTANPDDTRILKVTVESDTPERAKTIVDAICTIGTVKIQEAMGFQQVNLYEYGIANSAPCNQTGMLTYAFVGVVAAVLAYSLFLLVFLLNDQISTPEDIERYLGLTVLSEIPDANDSKNKNSKYSKYGKYGKHSGAYGSNKE